MRKKKVMPGFLKPGDEVAIISPSWAIDEDKINAAVSFLEGWGLRVTVGKNALKRSGPFAGTDAERLEDLQKATDNPGVRAIVCSRGGYGMLRIIDRADFSSLTRSPKWYVGFSDITVLHIWLSEIMGIVSIHGDMPLNYSNPDKSPETFETLHNALFGTYMPISWEGRILRPSNVSGEITGGNLSLLYSLAGTKVSPGTSGKILFIEEVGEYYYHLDRMLTSMKMSGMFRGISALVAGGFTMMEETSVPWGKTAAEIIEEITAEYDFPVFFDFPAGHINDNRAFYIGRRAEIKTDGSTAILNYL